MINVKTQVDYNYFELNLNELARRLADQNAEFHEKIEGKCKFYMDIDYKENFKEGKKFSRHDTLMKEGSYKKLEPLILKSILSKLYAKFQTIDIIPTFQVCSSSAEKIISVHICADVIFENGPSILKWLKEIDFGECYCMIDEQAYASVKSMRTVYSTKKGRQLKPTPFELNGKTWQSSEKVEDHLIAYNCGEIQVFGPKKEPKVPKIIESKSNKTKEFYLETQELLNLLPKIWYEERNKRMLMVWAMASEDNCEEMRKICWNYYNRYVSNETQDKKEKEFDQYWDKVNLERLAMTWTDLYTQNISVENIDSIKSKYNPKYSEEKAVKVKEEKMVSYRLFEDEDHKYCWQDFLKQYKDMHIDICDEKYNDCTDLYYKTMEELRANMKTVVKFINREGLMVLIKQYGKGDEIEYSKVTCKDFVTNNKYHTHNMFKRDHRKENPVTKIILKTPLTNYIMDEQTSYDDCGFYPILGEKEGYFNYFKGFKAKKVPEVDMSKINKILEHIKNLCGGDESDTRYALDQFGNVTKTRR